ncbi:MAG: segregation/condensation protein A [Candidatus Nanoarchaeia archaeon]
MEKEEKINQEQFFELVTGQEVSWQAIIYDLVKTEQLDPWDIDLGILAERYAEKIEEIEEANFFISSKVLLACALLLRLKSDILMNKYIQDLNEALYGKKEPIKQERIEIDEDELPELIPRTPMPRHRKISLNELMSALNKAVETENRRIRKEIKSRQAKQNSLIVLPKKNHIPIKSRIRIILDKIRKALREEQRIHITYSELAPSKEEKLASFLPVLHLHNQEKIYIRQEQHFQELYMTLESNHNNL